MIASADNGRVASIGPLEAVIILLMLAGIVGPIVYVALQWSRRRTCPRCDTPVRRAHRLCPSCGFDFGQPPRTQS
jgi:hypothetical protein